MVEPEKTHIARNEHETSSNLIFSSSNLIFSSSNLIFFIFQLDFSGSRAVCSGNIFCRQNVPHNEKSCLLDLVEGFFVMELMTL